MSIRVAKGSVKTTYKSKAYQEYEKARNRLDLVHGFSNDIFAMANRRGFMSRILHPEKPDPAPIARHETPALKPYVRHGLYPIPKSWPKSFEFTCQEVAKINEAFRHSKLMNTVVLC